MRDWYENLTRFIPEALDFSIDTVCLILILNIKNIFVVILFLIIVVTSVPFGVIGNK